MKILGLVVVYDRKIRETKTINSLVDNFKNFNEVFQDFSLLIHDNSKEDQANSFSLPFSYRYFHSQSNNGLGIAYNKALDEAGKNNYEWILLLDQDSSLPCNFLNSIYDELKNDVLNQEIVAVVPKMCYNGVFFSPSKVLYGGIHRPINMNFKGIYPEEVFAIGSGSLLRTEFFIRTGGFNEFFWLDCLDRWIYQHIYRNGKKVLVNNIIIEHELSVMDYSKFVSEDRYTNIMTYETYFMRSYKSFFENLIYIIRLSRRSVLFLVKNETRKFFSPTIRHITDLIFHWQQFRIAKDNPNHKY
jgi:GT2 family glycosyltransferase